MLQTHPQNLPKDETGVLHHLLWHGPLTRQQLAFATGYSRTKLGQMLECLQDASWVTEVGQQDSAGGRRPSLYALNPGSGVYLGVETSPQGIKMALCDGSLNPIEERHVPMDVRQPPAQVASQIQHLIQHLLQKQGIQNHQLLAVTLGVPHTAEKTSRNLAFPAGWDANSWQDQLYRHLDAPVFLEQHTHLMALGELWHGRRMGEGSRQESFLVLKLCSSIHAGLVINGQIYRGSSGGAGDVAHISLQPDGPRCVCGQQGCLERMVGAQALLEQATRAGVTGQSPFFQMRLQEGKSLQVSDLTQASAHGDPAAHQILQQAGLKIGEALVGLINVLCPSHILIGGELAHTSPLMLAGIRQSIYGKGMPRATRKLTIDYTRLGEKATLMGSLVHAMLQSWHLHL